MIHNYAQFLFTIMDLSNSCPTRPTPNEGGNKEIILKQKSGVGV